MKLGLTRLDHNMAVIQVDGSTRRWRAIGFMASMMSGQVAAAQWGDPQDAVRVTFLTLYLLQ